MDSTPFLCLTCMAFEEEWGKERRKEGGGRRDGKKEGREEWRRQEEG